MPSHVLWWAWGVSALMLSAFLAWAMSSSDTTITGTPFRPATLFLPGAGSAGHYQIETQCELCHAPFAGVPQEQCLHCHREELAQVDDTHAPGIFGAAHERQLSVLDARRCTTCHGEHDPERTQHIGVTVSDQFCKVCHGRIRQTSATHVDLTFDLCTGCHNYHDNTSLSEEFLREFGEQPALLAHPRLPVPDKKAQAGEIPLPDAPASQLQDASVTGHWQESSHARSGVNCMQCHGAKETTKQPAWVAKPGTIVCAGCHEAETREFLRSRKGMRIAQGLPPLRVRESRLPMQPEARDELLECGSCHAPHQDDTPEIAWQTCVSCHDSRHTHAYQDSPHHQLWQNEQAGDTPPGSGVSCATCHLPRVQGAAGPRVIHDVNAMLRPGEKMVQSVCMHCHGAKFSLQSIADRQQIDANFGFPPVPRRQSLEAWIREHGSLSAPVRAR